MKIKLTKYEKELLRAVEAGEFVSVPNFEKSKKELQAYAKYTLELIAKGQHSSQRKK